MAGKSKALTRKITRKQAMSYNRMSPNKRGVTALSEVNGEGAYAQRYARAREMLEGEPMKTRRAPSTKKKFLAQQKRQGRTAAQAESAWKLKRRSKGSSSTVTAKSKTRGSKSRMTPNLRKKATKKRKGASARKSSAKKPQTKRMSKKEFLASQRKQGRSKAQAEADWKLATGYYEKAKKRKRKPRTYGKGKYRALKAKIGPKTRPTYKYKTKKGYVRDIPDHAILGFKSAAAMRKVLERGSREESEKLRDRLQRLYDRRERKARQTADRIRRGKGVFVPNAGDEILSFEQWSQEKMKKNKAKSSRKSSARKKHRSKKSFMHAMYAKGRTKKQAEAAWKRGQRSVGKKTTTKRRRKTSAKKARIRNLKKACTKVRKMKANKKGSYTKRSTSTRSIAKRRSSAPKRKSTKRSVTKRKSTKRKMKANVAGYAYRQELKNSFKYGLIVLGGFVTHRVLANMLDTYGLAKVGYLNKGAVAGWRKQIASALVAAVGIPLTVRALPTNAGVAAAGMGASVLYDLLIAGLKRAEQPKLLEAVSAYPDAPGFPQYSGMGAYYEYQPHQVYGAPMGGFGEFYETQPVPGLEQAAAGMGEMPVMQAAAGLQQMYANRSQMGEYYAYGANGIGEYETSTPEAGDYPVYDGLQPTLDEAEQALDVAEASAGFGNDYPMLQQAAAGFGDLPLEQTVQPMIRAMDIPDSPGGSRAGILGGGDGIFG